MRSDGLRNAMKNMSIGDVRPREEDEDEDGPSISKELILQLISQMIKHNKLYKIQVMMILKYKIKLVHLVHLHHQLKNPLFLKEFIMFLQRITRWIKSW